MAAQPRVPADLAMQIEFGQASDPGLDPAKRINEDSCGYAETQFGHLFVICDGMGGHAGGKQASDIAIRTVFEKITAAPTSLSSSEALVAAIREAARRVYDFGGPPSNQQRPGSTCVALMLHGGRAHVAHVGDSRAYAIRGNQIYRLTRDHSMVQELVDNGMISEQEAMGHPDSNKITRALGMTPDVDVEVRREPMEVYEGDVFLLASDGLTDLARNDDILVTVNEYLRTQDPQAVCDELVALANRRGGHDNITVQVVRVLKNAPGSSPTLAQGPAAGSRVATTVDGTPAPIGATPHTPAPPGETVVQEPAFRHGSPEPPSADPLHGAVAPTDPGAPSPTMVDPMLAAAPISTPRPPQPAVPPPQPSSALIYLVLAMAGVIGLLLALLVWALLFK